jgi:hypothetical protein
MRIDHNLVVVAARDIDGSEVNVDHELPPACAASVS